MACGVVKLIFLVQQGDQTPEAVNRAMKLEGSTRYRAFCDHKGDCWLPKKKSLLYGLSFI
jgi:hypothetical protein